jgi:hypothetical protein
MNERPSACERHVQPLRANAVLTLEASATSSSMIAIRMVRGVTL